MNIYFLTARNINRYIKSPQNVRQNTPKKEKMDKAILYIFFTQLYMLIISCR